MSIGIPYTSIKIPIPFYNSIQIPNFYDSNITSFSVNGVPLVTFTLIAITTLVLGTATMMDTEPTQEKVEQVEQEPEQVPEQQTGGKSKRKKNAKRRTKKHKI